MDPKIAGYSKIGAFALALVACTLLCALGKIGEPSFVQVMSIGLPTFLGAMALSSSAGSIGAGMQAKAAAQIATMATPLVGVLETREVPKGGAS